MNAKSSAPVSGPAGPRRDSREAKARTRFSPKGLEFRIVALFLGLLLLVQTGSLLLIGSRIVDNARGAVNAELRAGERVFQRLLRQQSAHLGDSMRYAQAEPAFVAALAAGDASSLDELARRTGATLVLAADAQLRVRATYGDGGRLLPRLRAATSVSAGPKTVGAEPGAAIVFVDGQPMLWAVQALHGASSGGWIAVARPIPPPLLRDMREMFSIDVALLTRHDGAARWELAQATLPSSDVQGLGERWGEVVRAARAQGESAASGMLDLPASTDGAPRTVLARSIALGHDGPQEAVALLMRSLEEASAPYRRLEAVLFAFSAIAVAVFGIGSVFTARRITTPLLALTASARRLGQGDYAHPLHVKGGDEIAELAQTFEVMRRAVQEREAQVRRLAFEDGLTRLPNREGFRAALREALRIDASGMPRACAVLMLDLDRFKHVNDVLGHRFGDRLLREVARRLVEHDGRGHTIARLGGDEFALLVPQAEPDAAQHVARGILRGFEEPITLDDHTVDLSAGIGIACCPQHGVDADALMVHAEIAMYAAKSRQSGVVVYEASQDTSSGESLSLMSELRTAIDRQQLRLWLQPKVSLATGNVIGAEALVRWQHPQSGLVPPMQFVPFAEQTGFIRQLTAWMIDRGAAVLQRLHHAGIPIKLSINLSTRDLLDQELPAKLQRLSELRSMVPGTLCLEITESAIMDDPARALQTLEALHALGFKLSIDDFGTGYSSLAYLKRLPVHELKIDKSFVLNMEHDLDDAKIVRSVVDLAHNLGLNVVAEGVETAHAWKMLQALGCDEAQGYFIAKPMPEALFANWMAEWTAPQTQAVQLGTAFAALV